MNVGRQRAWTAALALSWASLALALGEGRPPGAEYYPEMTQDQVAEQQSHQDQMGEVGVVPGDTEVYAPSETDAAPQAQDVVSNASQERAAATVKQAGHKKSASTFPWWGLATFAALGAGGALGVRQWVVKNVPDMPPPPKRRW